MSKPRGDPASKTKSVTRPTELRIGTSGWHYEAWSGPFYPTGMASKDFLSFYVEHFNTTEINNSFYRLPSETMVRVWRDSAPEGFLFAWKASRYITHLKRLKDVGDSIDLVFRRMAGLGPASGPVLFQLPPSLKAEPDNLQRLARCLQLIPSGQSCALEFRHPSWYEDRALDLLRDHNAALCFSDHPAAPAPWTVTADFIYMRAHGAQGVYSGRYSADILKRWACAVTGWRKDRRDVYVYFNNDAQCAAPRDAQMLIDFARAQGAR